MSFGYFSGISQLLGGKFVACTLLYYMLSAAAAVYSNELQLHVLYSSIGPVILGPAESAMPWVYYYLPVRLN